MSNKNTTLSRRSFLGGTAAVAAASKLQNASAQTKEASYQINSNIVPTVQHTEKSLVDFIRTDCGLTGTKKACGQGVCGSCVVLVDGKTVNSCLLPLSAVRGKQVHTIESISKEKIHPIQQAFMECDALQCGYCTPGFIVESVSLYDSWKKETPPSREQIAHALSGHLCRCGAYSNIYEAVENAFSNRAKGEGAKEEEIARSDAREKVLGTAKYTTDIQLSEMLHAKIIRSQFAHADINSVDMGGYSGPVFRFFMDGATLRYVGQEVLAIAAQSEEEVELLAQKITVHYTPKPSVQTIDAALEANAPLVYTKEQTTQATSAAEGGGAFPAPWSGNLRGPSRLDFFCRPEKAEAILHKEQYSGERYSQSYFAHPQCHTSLEPHACVASWKKDELEVWVSTQSVHMMQEELAERFELPVEKVRVHGQYVGGGFGAKAGMQSEVLAAVMLSKQHQKPVRLVLSREEELLVGGVRPEAKVRVSLAQSKEGILEALGMEGWSNSGAAVGGSVGIMGRLLYTQAAKSLKDWDVLTNNALGKPFRGPGGPAGLWALEQAVDHVAHQRNEDPINVRMRWDSKSHRKRLYQWAQELDIWKRRKELPKDGRFVEGVGVAVATWGHLLNPRARVELQTTSTGEVVIRSATQDMGNGTASAMSGALSTELGIPLSQIKVQIGDSNFAKGAPSFGSQTTSSMAPAVIDAAERLKEELVEEASDVLGWKQVRREEFGVSHKSGKATWSELIRALPEIRVLGRRPRDSKGYLLRAGPFAVGLSEPGCVQVYHIRVDTETGAIRVLGGWLGIAAGVIHSPVVAKSQALGGMVQGISYALCEEKRVDPNTGFPLTTDFNDYHLLGIGDTPSLHVYFDQEPFDTQGGGVGLAEMCTVGSAAALGNAFFDATGVRCTNLPLRLDRIMELL